MSKGLIHKKNYLIGFSVFITFIVVCVLAIFVHSSKVAYGQYNFGQQCQQIINALNVQANHRAATGDNVVVDADSQSVINEAAELSQKPIANLNYVFPLNFDLRNANLDGSGAKNYVTSVKYQNPWGSCWAFGAIAASEVSILTKLGLNSYYVDASGNKHDTIDLSEHHLTWFNYSPMQNFETTTQAGEGAYSMTEEEAIQQGDPWALSQRMATGGVSMSATSTFAMGIGPVQEPDFYDPNVSPIIRQLLYKGINGYIEERPSGYNYYSKEDDWSIDYSLRFNPRYKLKQALILPDCSTPEGQEYDIEHAKLVTNMMKEQLMQGRALHIGFTVDQARPDTPVEDWKYLNPINWAHYTYEYSIASHDVTIVGWDDNYSKENFVPGHLPPENGAWIVKNSWGSLDSWAPGLNKSKWGINDSGYFYLSYYDRSLICEEAYDYDVSESSADVTITNQHDYMPCEAAKAIEQSAPVTTANVFVADQDQYVSDIGAITSTENETATYKLYKLNSKDQRIDEGQLLCSVSEEYAYMGFHRVKLNSRYLMAKGDVFAVTMTQSSGNKYLMGVSSEANRLGYEAGKAGDYYYCNGIVNPGESYLYTSNDDTWTDFSIVKKELESGGGDAKYYTYDNFPIKVYSAPASIPSPVPDPEETYDIANTGDSNIAIIMLTFVVFSISVVGFRKFKKIIVL